MKKRILLMVNVLLFSFVISLFGGLSAWAAQSTADVAVDNAAKERIRKEIVGSSVSPGQQQAYTIGYGDILSVTVYGEGNMATSGGGQSDSPLTGGAGAAAGVAQTRPRADGIEVHMDGTISLLHIGDVQAVGMTTAQLADYLKKLYSSVFADPILTVTLVQSNSRRYTVMGKVSHPGIFYLDFPVTVVQAVARSGGFTEWANHDVSVIHQDGAGLSKGITEKVSQFDYDAFLRGRNLEKNVYIQPNDVIIVH